MNTMMQDSGATGGPAFPARGTARPAGGNAGRPRSAGYTGAPTMGDSWDRGAKSSATGHGEPHDGSGQVTGFSGWLHALFG